MWNKLWEVCFRFFFLTPSQFSFRSVSASLPHLFHSFSSSLTLMFTVSKTMSDWIGHYLVFPPEERDTVTVCVLERVCEFERCLVSFNNSSGFCYCGSCDARGGGSKGEIPREAERGRRTEIWQILFCVAVIDFPYPLLYHFLQHVLKTHHFHSRFRKQYQFGFPPESKCLLN